MNDEEREAYFASLKHIPNEAIEVRWDDEFDCYGLFGLKSGFCYSQHELKEDAETALDNL